MASSNATIAGLRHVAFTVNASQFAAAIADANAVSGEGYPTDPAEWRLGHWNVEAEGEGGDGDGPGEGGEGMGRDGIAPLRPPLRAGTGDGRMGHEVAGLSIALV